jgi:hypothetical protein
MSILLEKKTAYDSKNKNKGNLNGILFRSWLAISSGCVNNEIW